MQPVLTSDRLDFTRDEILRIIQLGESMVVGAGLELLDPDLNVLQDLSPYLQDGGVTHSNYATLHNSLSLKLTEQLNWGSAIVRPYLLIGESESRLARFNLGAYFTNTPDNVTGETPTTYDVTGYDVLERLDTPLGDSYALVTGTNVLETVENILINQGYTQYTIDPARTDATLTSDRGWAMSDQVTWMSIVNDLLGLIGYRGVYTDWDGRPVCEPYREPAVRQVEWVYTDETATSQLDPSQTIGHDFYKTPNQFIGVRTNMPDGTLPTEGDGLYIYTNYYDGETSVEARGNRVIPTRIETEAVDQAALETAVQRAADNAKVVGTTVTTRTTPNPLHWHFDVIELTTDLVGTYRLQAIEWALPFNGGQMSHRWSVV